MFEAFGLGPDYVETRGGSYFTLEAHIHYLREVHLEDPLRVTLQLLDYDGKRCHFYEEMFHETEGWQAAAGEAVPSAAVDAESALIGLGYKQTEARKAVAAIVRV